MNEELQEDIKKLLGVSPYDTPSNICRNDPYFVKSLEEKYGKPIDQLIREANVN